MQNESCEIGLIKWFKIYWVVLQTLKRIEILSVIFLFFSYYSSADFPDFKPIICNNCDVVGHKSNACKLNLKISPTRIILCGICE